MNVIIGSQFLLVDHREAWADTKRPVLVNRESKARYYAGDLVGKETADKVVLAAIKGRELTADEQKLVDAFIGESK